MTRWAVTFRAVLLSLLLAILGTGLAFVVIRANEPAQRVEIILPSDQEAGSAARVVVYVSGAVGHEGVYALRQGDRVADAVDAAGGLNPEADRRLVNLAARLVDEQHIHVPPVGEPAVPASASPSQAAAININTATEEDLDRLPGIGEVMASAIIDYRNAHGPFTRIEDLLRVPRMGEATLARIRPLISL